MCLGLLRIGSQQTFLLTSVLDYLIFLSLRKNIDMRVNFQYNRITAKHTKLIGK